jgi:hypothetical protein
MALVEPAQVCGLDFPDVSRIDFPIGNHPRFHQLRQPGGVKRIDFVVVGCFHKKDSGFRSSVISVFSVVNVFASTRHDFAPTFGGLIVTLWE